MTSSLATAKKAVEFFQRAQAIDPDDVTALEALERLYMRHKRWEELLSVMRKKVELASDPQIRETYFPDGERWREKVLGNFEKAIETYKKCSGGTTPTCRRCRALDRLYLQQMWNDLSENPSAPAGAETGAGGSGHFAQSTRQSARD